MAAAIVAVSAGWAMGAARNVSAQQSFRSGHQAVDFFWLELAGFIAVLQVAALYDSWWALVSGVVAAESPALLASPGQALTGRLAEARA